MIEDELLTVAAVLHDIGLYPAASRGGVYTADGAELAREILPAHGWDADRVRRCALAIDRHHDLRNQRAAGAEVEAIRLADLADVSGGLLAFGLDRDWLRALRRDVPRDGMTGELAREVGRALRERPLTMPRIFWRTTVVAAVLAATALAGGIGRSSALAAGPALTWSAPRKIDSHGLNALRCPTATLCIAIDSAGDILTTRTPTTGSWKSARVDRALTALACPSASLCVAVDSNGRILVSRDPAGGARTWTRTAQLAGGDGANELSAVACRGHLCVAGGQGTAFVSTDPTGGRAAWRTIGLPENGDSPGILSGFSCPLKSLCVGVDQSTGEGFIDDVFTSTDPTRPSSWNLKTEFTNNSLDGVACPTRSLCVAPTDGGRVVTSTDPTRASSWHSAALSDDDSADSVACPSASLCVLGDDDGNIDTSTDPAGGRTAWTSEHVAPNGPINALSCVSSRLCIGVTGRGDVIAGT